MGCEAITLFVFIDRRFSTSNFFVLWKFHNDLAICQALLGDFRYMKAKVFETVTRPREYRLQFYRVADRPMTAIECELQGMLRCK